MWHSTNTGGVIYIYTNNTFNNDRKINRLS